MIFFKNIRKLNGESLLYINNIPAYFILKKYEVNDRIYKLTFLNKNGYEIHYLTIVEEYLILCSKVNINSTGEDRNIRKTDLLDFLK